MLHRELSKHSHPTAAGGGGGSHVGAATVPEAVAGLPERRAPGDAAEPAPEEQGQGQGQGLPAGAGSVAQP